MVMRRFHSIARQSLLVATLAALAVGGILLGTDRASAAHPGRGHRQVDCLRAIAGGVRLTGALDELVANGTITSEQATAILDRLGETRPDSARVCDGILLAGNGPVGEAVRDLLGMDRREIRQAWRDGQSLAEMAEAKGVDRQTLISTITDAVGARLDKLVERGTITVERKDEILTKAAPVIERAIDLHRGELRERATGGAATPESTPVDR